MKTHFKFYYLIFVLAFITSFFNAKAQIAPNLGTGNEFGLLSGGNITANDTSYIDGNIGAVGNIDTILIVNGSVFPNNTTEVQTGISDLNNAIAACSNQSGILLSSEQVNDTTLTAGVYEINGNLTLTGTLTLTGNSGSIFIFNITDSAIFKSNSEIFLDEVLSSNVFFNIANSLTIEGNSIQRCIYLVGGKSYLFGINYFDKAILCLEDIFLDGFNKLSSYSFMLVPIFQPFYTDEACNLDYVHASVQLNGRQSASIPSQGVPQPATFNITVPNNVIVRRAFIYIAVVGRPQLLSPPFSRNFNLIVDGVPSLVTSTPTVNNPLFWNINSTCWTPEQFQGTAAYVAEVTNLVNNNPGTVYEISGLPVNQFGGWNIYDTYGATLIISYTSDCGSNDSFWGYLQISDGLIVDFPGGPAVSDNTIIPAPGNQLTNSSAFAILGDVEMAIPANSNSVIFGNTSIAVNNIFWQVVEIQPAPDLIANTTQYNFAFSATGIDCINVVATGVYYRTNNSACSMTIPTAPVITGTPSACELPDDQTYEVTNVLQGATYTWTTVNGTPASGTGYTAIVSFPDLTGGSITFTVTNANGCENSSTFNVYPCCLGDLTLTNISTSTIYQDILINGSNSQYAPYFAILVPNSLYLQSNLSSVPPTGNDIIAVNGIFTIDLDLDITHSEIILGPSAKIVIEPTFKLRTDNLTYMHSCGEYMWDGIYITDNTACFRPWGATFIEDAVNAVVSIDGGVFDMRGPRFNRNFKNLVVMEYNQTHTGTIRSTEFKCTDNIFASPGNPSVISLPPHAGQRSFSGVEAYLVDNLNVGEESTYLQGIPTNHFYNFRLWNNFQSY